MNGRCVIVVLTTALMTMAFAGFSPAGELTVTQVTPSSPHRIFYQGEPISFQIELTGADLPDNVSLVVRQIRNYYDSSIAKWDVFNGVNRAMDVVAEGSAAASKQAGKTVLKFTLNAPGLGAMRVLAKVGGQDIPLADYLHVLPPNDVSPDDSIFAVDMCNPKNFDQYGRAGVKVVRWETGIRYKNRESTDFDFSEEIARLEAMKKAGIKAFLIIGHDAGDKWIRFPGTNRTLSYAGGNKPETQPPPRRMDEFARWCGEYAKLMKGNARGYEFFNEPWEGGSISGASGGGAQIRRLLAAGAPVIKKVDPAARIAAACSIMNAEDSYLPYPETMALMDVISTHTYYNWGDYGAAVARRLGKEVWDTESWCVMTDDHGPMKSAHQVHQGYKIIEPLGTEMDITSPTNPWTSGSATYITGQRFLDAMKPAGVVMKGRVPTILLFEGRGRTVAFLHNISIARPGAETEGEFPGNVPYRQQEPDIANPNYTAPGTFTIPAAGISVYDVFGNALPRDGNTFRVPVGRFGYYVVAPKLDALRTALESGKLEGISPFYIKILDFTERLAPGARLRVTLTNVYPADEKAAITVDGGDALQFETPTAELALAPGEQKIAEFTVKQAKLTPINKYRITVFAKGVNGQSSYTEDINQAVIVKGTPAVDGDLADWEALKPVPVFMARKAEYVNALAAYMQLPFAEMTQKDAQAYLVQAQFAWDAKNFYVAVQINDPTEVRRESNAYGRRGEAYPWPNQHIYMGPPQLTGCSGDCLLFAFNTNDDNTRVWDFLPKDNPLYRVYPWPDTDYEFEILPVQYNKERDEYLARNFGQIVDPKTKERKPAWPGYPESEVWRLYDPKMIYRHHAYPFNMPTQEYDQGLVPGATSVVKRDGSTWIYEAAIPWDQLWEVKPQAGSRVRFAFYTRNDGGHGLEYTEGKSVSVRNLLTFHPMWEHKWSNDCEWGFGD